MEIELKLLVDEHAAQALRQHALFHPRPDQAFSRIDMQRPIAEVVRLYEDVLEYLRAHAKVSDFLPILVSKKVRELCRRKN